MAAEKIVTESALAALASDAKWAIYDVLPGGSASGNPCTFDTDIAVPLKSLIANIVASGGGGTPSTPIPIVGHSELNLANVDDTTAQLWAIDSSFDGTVTFNQLFTATASRTYDSIITTFDSATGILHSSGTTASTYYFFVNGADHKIPITSGHKYFVHIDDTRTVRYAVYDGGTNRNIVDKIGATIINSTYSGWLSLVSMNNTVGANVDITCKPIVIDLTQMFGAAIADYIYNLEQATAGAGVAFFKYFYPEDYYPYNAGETQILVPMPYTVSFGQTVYGGVYTVDGKLRLTHGYMLIDENTVMSPNGATDNSSHFIINISGKAYGYDNFKSDKFANLTPYQDVDGYASGRVNSSNIEFFLPVSVAQTTAAGKAWFGANNTQLVYELATPIEIDVSELSVDTIVGTNNITSDCGGDVEVEYRESVEKYVNDHSATRTDVVGTLTAGQTSITLSSTAITTSSTIEVFTDPEIPYNTLTVSSGQAVLTFDAQANNVSVKVRVT